MALDAVKRDGYSELSFPPSFSLSLSRSLSHTLFPSNPPTLFLALSLSPALSLCLSLSPPPLSLPHKPVAFDAVARELCGELGRLLNLRTTTSQKCEAVPSRARI